MHLAVGFTLLALVGCAVGDERAGAVDRWQLPNAVLQLGDLPADFERVGQGRLDGVDAPSGLRADPARFGRVDGWHARYRRAAVTRMPGPDVVASRTDLFDSAEGAEAEMEAARQDARRAGWQPIDEPGLGDGSFAATAAGRGTVAARRYRVYWRDDNVVATLDVNGVEGSLPLADVLALARKQEQRIDDVAR